MKLSGVPSVTPALCSRYGNARGASSKPAVELAQMNIRHFGSHHNLARICQLAGCEVIGGLQDLQVLERLLDDEMEFHVGRRGMDSKFTSHLQDVALAGLLHLTEQDLQDYGFEEVRPHPTYLFTPGSIGFPDEESRAAALEKWRRWAAENLRELQPEPEWAIEGVAT